MWSAWHQPRGNVCVLGPWCRSRWVAPVAQRPALPSRSRCRAIGFRHSSGEAFRARVGGLLTSSCTTSFISDDSPPGMPPACSRTTASRDRSPAEAASSRSAAAPAAARAPGARSDRRLLSFGPWRERIAASTAVLAGLPVSDRSGWLERERRGSKLTRRAPIAMRRFSSTTADVDRIGVRPVTHRSSFQTCERGRPRPVVGVIVPSAAAGADLHVAVLPP
jgi:hypothetical protein